MLAKDERRRTKDQLFAQTSSSFVIRHSSFVQLRECYPISEPSRIIAWAAAPHKGMRSYGMWGYGMRSYGMWGYGMRSYGMRSHAMWGYGMWGYGMRGYRMRGYRQRS